MVMILNSSDWDCSNDGEDDGGQQTVVVVKQIYWCSDGDHDGDGDGGWCLLLGICCGDRCSVLEEP